MGLHGEFAGGCEDEHAGGASAFVLEGGVAGEDGEGGGGKGEGFAGAGFGNADYVSVAVLRGLGEENWL